MELTPLNFTCSDINGDVEVPESKRMFRELELRLENAIKAKKEIDKHPELFDAEDNEKVSELVKLYEKQFLDQAEKMNQLSDRLKVAASFAEQVNLRHEAVKKVRRIIGVDVLSNYFEEKQLRLALLAEQMLKEALSKTT